ncbi:hypothetical protein H6P81_012902 [Aristolochia fimbriata]|uniref:Disease resistance protein At4g27190-like leucine-rich repeats domain-containing protein n=1 Tax=Aristolochia fimbriata TaxID=158543 RepID=A0AAV7EDQ5_ARIFI|nr:hypothetical protein H6P81_012902 [Aristolochia fimbriata]
MKKLSFNNEGAILERGGLFPGLYELVLKELPNLTSICLFQPAEAKCFGKQLKQGLEDASISENDQMPAMRALAPNLAVFQNLITLTISSCHNLKYLFSLNMFQNGGLQELQEIHISDCNNLKWIIVNEQEDIFEEGEKRGGDMGLVSSGVDKEKGILLRSLIRLELRNLPELLSFYSWDDSLPLPSSLAFTTVQWCPKLGERPHHYPPERESLNDQQMPPLHVFGCLDGGVAAASWLNMGTSALKQLEELALKSLPNLSSIIYYGNPPKLPPLERIFLNLRTLEVVGCNRLRHLFPPPCALSAESSLPRLNRLRVSDCAELHIVNNNIASSSNSSSSSSLLIGNSTLINLSSSQSFSSAPVIFSLEKLRISGFDQTQHVFGFEEGICSSSVFHNLSPLVLEDLPRLESICRGYIPPGSLANLQVVKVGRCHSLRGCLQFSLILAGSLQNLESLVVDSCEKLEKLMMLPDEEEEDDDQKMVVVLPSVENLFLKDLPRLENLYGAGEAFLRLPSLKWTTVNNCSKLKQLPFGPWANPKDNPWADPWVDRWADRWADPWADPNVDPRETLFGTRILALKAAMLFKGALLDDN